MKTAVITGAAGQDGVYLTELLQQNNYQVISITSGGQTDICNKKHVNSLIARVKPDELYHLAAYHHSSERNRSDCELDEFEKSWRTHVLSTIYFLDAIKNFSPTTRMFFAASSQLYGLPTTPIQNEDSPFNPFNIYGITKHAGLKLCQVYRTNHNLFVAGGILFNHESPKRNNSFVSRKIIQYAVSISRGSLEKLTLGDLNAIVDWGFAGDYVDAMHRILQVDESGEFVIATGVEHSVRDFTNETFRQLGLNWEDHVETDQSILVPHKHRPLIGDPRKLQCKTGWVPTVSFEGLITLMLDSELASE